MAVQKGLLYALHIYVSTKIYILILNSVKGDFVSKYNADIDYLVSPCCHSKRKWMNDGKHERTGL
jgi:hypothetical protein